MERGVREIKIKYIEHNKPWLSSALILFLVLVLR